MQYEFTPDQNRMLAKLASYMRANSFVLGLAGLLFLAVVIVILGTAKQPTFWTWAILLGPIVVTLWIAAVTFTSSAAFRRIVITEQKDLDHLMQALGKLKSLYFIQAALWLALLIWLTISFVNMRITIQ